MFTFFFLEKVRPFQFCQVCPGSEINYACVNLCEIFQHYIALLHVCFKFTSNWESKQLCQFFICPQQTCAYRCHQLSIVFLNFLCSLRMWLICYSNVTTKLFVNLLHHFVTEEFVVNLLHHFVTSDILLL